MEAAHIDLSKSGHNPGNVEKCPSVSDARQSAPWQRDLLKKALCQFKKKRRCERALSPFLSSWVESKPTQQASSIAHSPRTLEQTQRTETVSKRLRNSPAAAFSGLNPAGQASTMGRLLYAPEFSLKQPACLQISELVLLLPTDSGEGVEIYVERSRIKIILQTLPCQDISNRSSRQTVSF